MVVARKRNWGYGKKRSVERVLESVDLTEDVSYYYYELKRILAHLLSHLSRYDPLGPGAENVADTGIAFERQRLLPNIPSGLTAEF